MNKIKELFTQLELEHTKYALKGNKAAGTRARILCLDLKNAAADLRKEIINQMKNKETK